MSEKPRTPKHTPPRRKVANGLVTLSSAAVLAIYAAGYQRTRSAAEQFDAAAAQRRPVVPAPAPAVRSSDLSASPVVTRTSEPEAVVAHAVLNRPADLPVGPTETKPSASEPAPTSVASKLVASEPAASVANAITSPGPAESPSALPENVATEGTVTPSGTPAAITPAATLAQYKDGTYHAWGRSRHGDVYAFVVIEDGRIVHAGYDKCQTRWSCTLIDHLGPQVVRRQSAEVDYVSGATDSGNAFYWGIVEALSKAKIDAAPETALDSRSTQK